MKRVLRKMDKILETFAKLENLIHKDEGNRGIGPIILKGELYEASKAIISPDVKNVAIITGFPCLLDFDIPTETDGISGALSIAKSITALGKRVTILTDECNEEVLIQSAMACQAQKGYIDNEDPESLPLFSLESFPPHSQFDEKDFRRFREIQESIDLVIAIERAGPSASGRYHTMRKRDMTHLLAPLEKLLDDNKLSIGIGDGGNEVGMGKVFDKIVSSSITNAPDIACVTAAKHLVVASVSDWGGYALANGVAYLAILDVIEQDDSTKQVIESAVDIFVTTDAEEFEICRNMINAGARDGITGKNEMFVDGMPIERSIEVLNSLRAIVVDSLKLT